MRSMDISLTFHLLGTRHLAVNDFYIVSMQKIELGTHTVCHDCRMILPLKFVVRLANAGYWRQLTVPT